MNQTSGPVPHLSLVGGSGGHRPNQPGVTCTPTGYRDNGTGSGLFLTLMANGNSKAPGFLPHGAGRSFHRPRNTFY
jgi:hypothetical protein